MMQPQDQGYFEDPSISEVILMIKFWWLDPELQLTGSVTLSDGSKEPLLESGVQSMTWKKDVVIVATTATKG